MKTISLFLVGVLLSFSAFANDLSGKNFLFQYEGDDHYAVRFADTVLTWEGVKGADLGKSETDAYRLKEVASKIYLINWIENNGTFVAVVMNLESMKVFSTGEKYGEYQWFREGLISDL